LARFCIRFSREGKIIGGVAQGIGFSLYEKVVWQNGRMRNSQMTNYIIPASTDLPPIRVFFEELGNVHGAYGAKGIGELSHGWSSSGDRKCRFRGAWSSVRFHTSAAGRHHGVARFRRKAQLILRGRSDDE